MNSSIFNAVTIPRKKSLLFVSAFLFFLPLFMRAQGNVGIGTDNPDPSALLDLVATDKGVLIPRLTTVQRVALGTTASRGLLVFDDDEGLFYFFNGVEWEPIISGSNDDADPAPDNELLQNVVLNGSVLELTDAGGTTTVDLSSLAEGSGGGDNLGNHTATQNLNMDNNRITGMGEPLGFQDAATKYYVDINDDVNDADADPNNEIQVLSKSGNTVSLSKGGGSFTDEVDDSDADPANELIQNAELSGSVLELTDAGGTTTVDLSSLGGGTSGGDNLGDHTATQNLNMNNYRITSIAEPVGIQDATTKNYVDSNDDVNDADADPTNELQDWSTLPGIPSGFADNSDNVDDADADPTNELQALSEVLSQGNDAGNQIISNLADPANAQDAVTKSYVDNNDNVNDADSDPANELLQNAELNGLVLELTDAGGTTIVDLSSLGGTGGGDNLGNHTATQNLNMDNYRVTSVAEPVGLQDATTKNYVDSNDDVEDADADPTNELQDWSTLPGIPVDFSDNTDNVDDADSDPTNELQTLGGVLSQGNDAGNLAIINLSNPANPQDAATKSYVDNNDNVNDADSDPTNELQDWNTLPGIPSGFSDNIDNVDDADADSNNELNLSIQLNGTNLEITDAGGTVSVDLSPLINSAPTYSIGDTAFGGIVFWVDSTGMHGLVSGMEDLVVWVIVYEDYVTTLSQRDGVYAGKINTIVNSGPYYEIEVTANYQDLYVRYLDLYLEYLVEYDTIGGYGDWYVPSKKELTLMYQNLHLNNLGNFANTNYASSTSKDPLSSVSCNLIGYPGGNANYCGPKVAWYLDFATGTPNPPPPPPQELPLSFIRPIRSF